LLNREILQYIMQRIEIFFMKFYIFLILVQPDSKTRMLYVLTPTDYIDMANNTNKTNIFIYHFG